MQQIARTPWIDSLRIIAIFLVLVVHSTEPFYLGGEGSLIRSLGDARWVSFFDSFARACVPLFVIASSYLLLPMRRGAADFMRRRVVRVLVPFLVWTAVYACVWGEPVQNFRSLLLNFNYAAGHLWFVYMLFGLYLLLPILSPWAERVSRRQLLFYLCICLFTSIIPFIREWAAEGSAPVIYGPTGIPNPAKYPLWANVAGIATAYFTTSAASLATCSSASISAASWARLVGRKLYSMASRCGSSAFGYASTAS